MRVWGWCVDEWEGDLPSGCFGRNARQDTRSQRRWHASVMVAGGGLRPRVPRKSWKSSKGFEFSSLRRPDSTAQCFMVGSRPRCIVNAVNAWSARLFGRHRQSSTACRAIRRAPLTLAIIVSPAFVARVKGSSKYRPFNDNINPSPSLRSETESMRHPACPP